VVFTYNLMKKNASINLGGLNISTVSSSADTVTITFPTSQYMNLVPFIAPAHPKSAR
jgi:hypothetical protein